MRLTVEPDLCQDVDAISLLHALFMARTACISKKKTCTGVFDGLYAFNNGFRIEGGGAAPVRLLASSLPDNSLRLSTFVQSLRQDADYVYADTVDTEQQSSVVRAKYAIVTGTPAATGRIRYQPPLPFLRQGLV